MVYGIGIVTTVYISDGIDDGLIVVDSFVRYHLSVGFTHIYLFWDDAKKSDKTCDYLNRIQQYYSKKKLTIVYRDQVLLLLYQKYCSKYHELLPYMVSSSSSSSSPS